MIKKCSPIIRAAACAAAITALAPSALAQKEKDRLEDHMVLNYHLIHPGFRNYTAGDPNGCFYVDGKYHLHYLLGGKGGPAYAHVSSPDMLHWEWHRTSLTAEFSGFGNLSGGHCLSKEGLPVLIYHIDNLLDGDSVITVAKDRTMEAWEKPWPMNPKYPDGSPVLDWKKPYAFDPDNIGDQRVICNWSPDITLVGDTYYVYQNGVDYPLFTSKDLRNWTFKGDFIPRGKTGRYLTHEFPDVACFEDISCSKFFPIRDPEGNETGKWMLLCISHGLGCRYYIGERTPEGQFIPESHARMNWQRLNVSVNSGASPLVFAPDSVETADGRRVMWAWIRPGDIQTGLTHGGRAISREEYIQHAMMSIPRELSLADDGIVRIKPVRELEKQRRNPVTQKDIKCTIPLLNSFVSAWTKVADLPGESCEIRIVIDRKEAEGQILGFQLFSDEKDWTGFDIELRPDSKSIVMGSERNMLVSAPFDLTALPPEEDLEIRIFIDKFLVEVFVNDRQALVGSHMNWKGKPTLHVSKLYWPYTKPLTIKEITTWEIEPTNQGLLEARDNPIWKVER